MRKQRTAAAQTRFDTARRLPALLASVEEIAETWDEDEPFDAGTADAADLLTGLVEAWRAFTSPQP